MQAPQERFRRASLVVRAPVPLGWGQFVSMKCRYRFLGAWVELGPHDVIRPPWLTHECWRQANCQSMAGISWRRSVPTEKPRSSKFAGVGAQSIRSRTSTHSDITKDLGTLYSFDERFAIRYLLCGRRVVSATSCPPRRRSHDYERALSFSASR